jgi:methyltransferase-like protein 6
MQWRASQTAARAAPTWKPVAHCAARSPKMTRCFAYVGDRAPLAAEYHDCDFAFDEHAKLMQPLLETVNQQAPAACPDISGEEWEAFYKCHPRARFFKERRYLLLEFPTLAVADPPQHIVELGCGCGSAILPILRSNPTARATVCDISPTSVSQLQDAAASAGISERVHSFAANAADLNLHERLIHLQANACLIVFTLSAVLPHEMLIMLRNAYASLAPGGVFLIRDHGMYDMVQMRMQTANRLDTNLYRLADGTISYFFTTEDLAAKCISVGFEVVECKYVTINSTNRKTNLTLKRVFVHGVFRKPA